MDEPVTRGSPEPLPGKCGAKLAGTDPARYCKRAPLRGRTRCRKHGGKSPTGPASPHWKHGRRSRYSKVLPQGAMLRGYLDTIQTAELRSLREQIGLATGLEEECVTRLAAGVGSFTAWKRARDLGDALEAALRKKDDAAAGAALRELLPVLRTGGSEADAAADLAEVLELGRRLRDTESKMAFRIAGAVTVDQLLVMMRTVADTALQFIRAQEDRARFAHEMRALASGEAKLQVVR